MKRIIIMAAVAALATASYAQTMYEGVKFTDRDLNGTARFVGMGGAMGALGGDISTISTNPAGIGIYRSNDIMTSFGFSAFGTETNYLGNKLNNDKSRVTFDNIGAVFSSKIGNYTALRYVNFGFNYKKAKNFYNNTSMAGDLPDFVSGGEEYLVSQTNQMARQAYGAYNGPLGSKNAFSDPELGWLSILGYQGGVIVPVAGTNDQYRSKALDYNYYPYADFYSEERGGIDQYDFNVAFNFNDRFYLGLTIGAYDVDYSKYSLYDESFSPNDGYSLETWNNISGAGFDFKLGTIFRPFEYSPLRVGLAVHTPTFYQLTSEREAYLKSNLNGKRIEVDSYAALGNRVNATEFRLRTPWKFNASLGYTIGKDLALGAEYEYQDYSTVTFQDSYGNRLDDRYENTAGDMLKGVHALRLGLEYKIIPEFAFRAGYNFTTSAFKANAYSKLPYYSVATDTDFTNSDTRNDFTLGVGYRGSIFYTDLAYKYTTCKGDFYAFDDENLQATKLTNTRSQVLFTVGMRF